MSRSYVSYPLFRIQIPFKIINQLARTSSYHAIIDMNCQYDDVSPDFLEEYPMIRFCSSEPQFVERLAERIIPVPSSLFQPIQGLQQLPHPLPAIFGFITDRLFQVNHLILFQIGVQIGRVKVKGVHWPTVPSS